MALDDSGKKGVWPSDVRRAFFFGGVVLPIENVERLRQVFGKLRPDGGELKSTEFAASLGIDNGTEFGVGAEEGALSVLLSECGAWPLVLSFDKQEIGDGLTEPTRKGGKRIAPERAIPGLAAGLIHFLRKQDGVAEIFVDRMASAKEEDAIQQAWAREVRAFPCKRLPRRLQFVDSADSIEVQAADHTMGILRKALESDRPLRGGMSKLLRNAERQGLYVQHIQ